MKCNGCFNEKCKVQGSYRVDFTENKKIQSCNGCLKPFSKQHKECFKKFCCFCNIFFVSQKEHNDHINKYHSQYICKNCNECFIYIENHLKNYHSI